MTLLLAALALTGCRDLRTPKTATNPASEREQPLIRPSDATSVAHMLHQLLHSDQSESAAALQWLLTREDASELGYFHAESTGLPTRARRRV
jgi:hypothetical protein